MRKLIHNIFFKAWFICVLLILQTLLQSCVILPTPEHDVMGDLKIDASKIVVEKTSLEDVLIYFGEPTLYIKESSVFVYKWEVIDGYFMAVTPLAPIGGPTWTVNLFFVEFDKYNIVSRYEEKEIIESYVDNNLLISYAEKFLAHN